MGENGRFAKAALWLKKNKVGRIYGFGYALIGGNDD